MFAEVVYVDGLVCLTEKTQVAKNKRIPYFLSHLESDNLLLIY